MGQRSDDFYLLLMCDCGHERVIQVVTPLLNPIQRACPRCGAVQLHARAMPPAEGDMIDQVDHLVQCAISSLKLIEGLEQLRPDPRSRET